MDRVKTITLDSYRGYDDAEMIHRTEAFSRDLNRRRSVRDFSQKPVPLEVIENCLKAANSAPSGANQQPWHFAVVSDATVKKEIRIQAEAEEREFYNNRAPEEWLQALEPIGTDAQKPFLEIAPYLIAIFVQKFGYHESGEKKKHYYPFESVGIATGMLILAIHNAGLVSLTHTPSPMKFLNTILGRPSNERPFLLLVVGHPAEGVEVPDIKRKTLDQITTFFS
jgi:iodotyrosine deiodinase